MYLGFVKRGRGGMSGKIWYIKNFSGGIDARWGVKLKNGKTWRLSAQIRDTGLAGVSSGFWGVGVRGDGI